jgi:hypothetical protein
LAQALYDFKLVGLGGIDGWYVNIVVQNVLELAER